MKRAKIFINDSYAGDLEELVKGKKYRFAYLEGYVGDPVSLTMSTNQRVYLFDTFPPFFEGLLPEEPMLEALLRMKKLDADDYFEQLLCVGGEVVGNVNIYRQEKEP